MFILNIHSQSFLVEAIEIDRVKYLYLVENKDGAIATSSKYEIEKSVSGLQIIYNPYTLSGFKLKGFITDDEELVISDGKSPIAFELNAEKNEKLNATILKPIYTKEDLDFVAVTPENDNADDYDNGDYPDSTSNTNFKFNYKKNNLFLNYLLKTRILPISRAAIKKIGLK